MTIQKGHIAIVDDDREMRSLLEDFLVRQGYRVTPFSSAGDACKALCFAEAPLEVDVVISDIKMPQMDGLEFTRRVKKARPEIPVILITAFGSIETAIEAMRLGAFDYVVKPFKLAEMEVNLDRALENRRLRRDNEALRKEVRRTYGTAEIIGRSAAMRAVLDLVSRVAPATANVLVMGESGSGKEVVARAIHQQGPRAGHPFVAINCTAIPDTLLESELFGHAKGAFTGAVQRKRGLFEEADGGTLFLDEIGDMDLSLQAKLLRVIQEKKIRAVGENTTREVDVRIIAATHKDLRAACKEGRFREDLYYRLSIIPIVIPPLRQRREDIPLLADHFLRKAAASNQVNIQGFTPRALAKLASLRWEGNVRELENVIERTVVLAPGAHRESAHWLDEADIPGAEAETAEQFFGGAVADWPTLGDLERRYIELVLEKTAGRKDRAARILGINRRTLYRKEREYGWVMDGEGVVEGSAGRDDGETEGEYDADSH